MSMLGYNPKRHPEHKLILKEGARFAFSGYQHSMPNFPAIHYHDGNHRPSWKKYGSGALNVSLTVNPGGTLSIVTSEVAETDKGSSQKETYATLPAEVVKVLVDMLKKAEATLGDAQGVAKDQ